MTYERSRLLKNFLSLSCSLMISLIVPLTTVPYLMRVIGPEKFGLMAFAQVFVQYFIIVTEYGFNFSATREIAICKGDIEKVSVIYNAVLFIKILFAILSFIVLYLLVFSIPRFSKDWPVYLTSYGMLLGNVLFPLFLFQGLEKMKYIFFCNLCGLFSIAAIFILVKTPDDFLYAPAILSVSSLGTGVAAQWIACTKIKIIIRMPTFGNIKGELKKGWDVFISQVASASYNNSRVFVLGLFTSHIITGYYAVAEKLMYLVITFPLGILVQASFPYLTTHYSRDPWGAAVKIKQFQWFTLWGYFIVTVILFWTAPSVIMIFCGTPYEETILSFRIMLVAVLFVAANAFRIHGLLVLGKSRLFSKINILCGIAGLFLTLWLTYSFSYIGTAVSLTINALLALGLTLKEAPDR